jgi:hypothetical protein
VICCEPRQHIACARVAHAPRTPRASKLSSNTRSCICPSPLYDVAEKLKKISDAFESNPAGGRKGSVLHEKYRTGQLRHRGTEGEGKKHPTNEEVVKAVQQKVAVRYESGWGVVLCIHWCVVAKPST